MTTEDFVNVSTTKLDEDSVKAYQACIAGLRASAGGLFLNVESSTDSDIVVSVGWTPKGTQPSTIPITWSSAARPADGDFPANVVAGGQGIRFLRPSAETSLIVNSGVAGDSASVTLVPLPPPKVVPPKPFLAESCDATSPTADAPLAAGDSKVWLCPPLKGGKYLVSFSVGGHLTGDQKGMGARVNYNVRLGISKGQDMVLTGKDTAGDFDVPPQYQKSGLFPASFRIKDSFVIIPEGRAYLVLDVPDIHSHTDFQHGHYSSMKLSLPATAHFERVGDAN